MTILLAVLVGVWRLWLGRGSDGWPSAWLKADGKPFPGATYIQYAVAIGIMFLPGDPWNVAVTNGIGLLLIARVMGGHTPMLYGPGALPMNASIKGVEKFLYWIGDEIASDELRWWSFATLRYLLPAIAWSAALDAQGHQAGWLVVIATVLMIATYRLSWALRGLLGGNTVKFSELFGWAWIGAALALVI